MIHRETDSVTVEFGDMLSILDFPIRAKPVKGRPRLPSFLFKKEDGADAPDSPWGALQVPACTTDCWLHSPVRSSHCPKSTEAFFSSY